MPKTYTEVEFKEAVAHEVEQEVRKSALDLAIDVWEIILNDSRRGVILSDIMAKLDIYYHVCDKFGIDAFKLHAKLSEQYERDHPQT